MKDFRTKIGMFFVISHFVILSWVFICKFLGGYTFEELTTLIALLIPMFASYTTAIIKDVIKNAQNTKSVVNFYTSQFKFLTIFICTLFFIFILTIVTLKAFNYGFEDFEQLKITLGVAEAVFGAYVAQLIFSIYKPARPKPKETL